MKTLPARLVLALLALLSLSAAAVTRYVDLNSPGPTPPYTNWLTAATNIQDAVDAAVDADAVLVTDGVYSTGGRVVYGALTNRVAINKAIAVQSVNGPSFTTIHGFQVPGTTNDDGAVRCVYLTNGASLTGFTLANGATRNLGDAATEQYGGGVWSESPDGLVSACLIAGNSAFGAGGGAYGGTFTNCTFIGNQAGGGGAAYLSSLTSCVVVSNLAGSGGGVLEGTATGSRFAANYASDGGGAAYGGELTNCILTNNATGDAGGGAWGSTLNRCLVIKNTAGRHSGGAVGTLNSCVVVSNSAGGFAGGGIGTFNNCTIVGNSAPEGGGVYESGVHNSIVYYNSALSAENHIYSGLDYSCTFPATAEDGNFTNAPSFVNLSGGDFHLQPNSPCINAGKNSVVSGVTDSEGNPRIVGGTVDMGAYEFQSPASLMSYVWAQQNGLPTDGSADFTDADGDGMSNYGEWRSDTNPTNLLSVLRMTNATNSPTGAQVTWQSVSTRNYWLERATNLAGSSPFQTIATNISGSSGTTTTTDTGATNAGPYFYRVGVQ
jgi:hypothetical protein